jgi:peroxin-14
VAVENQQEKVDKATTDVEAAVQQMREGESRARNEIREIREEVNNISEMIPKVIISAFCITHMDLQPPTR